MKGSLGTQHGSSFELWKDFMHVKPSMPIKNLYLLNEVVIFIYIVLCKKQFVSVQIHSNHIVDEKIIKYQVHPNSAIKAALQKTILFQFNSVQDLFLSDSAVKFNISLSIKCL